MVLYSTENTTGYIRTFPGVKALQHVDFTLRCGKIHALMGENGAGKSTLIKVLTGVHTRDEGTILLDGKEIDNREASRLRTWQTAPAAALMIR